MSSRTSNCPACGLATTGAPTPYDGYFHASDGCWAVFVDVLAREYANPVLFGQVHQLTVDAYAVQHSGGAHPDKSIDVHLVGLHLVLERGLRPTAVPPYLQRLAARVQRWPHFVPPSERARFTAQDVAFTGCALEHAARAREWAGQVWSCWRAHHDEVRAFAELCFVADRDGASRS